MIKDDERKFINICYKLGAFDILTDREKLVLKRSLQNKTLEEISSEINVTKERVRQIRLKSFRKMKRFTRNSILDMDDKNEIFKKHEFYHLYESDMCKCKTCNNKFHSYILKETNNMCPFEYIEKNKDIIEDPNTLIKVNHYIRYKIPNNETEIKMTEYKRNLVKKYLCENKIHFYENVKLNDINIDFITIKDKTIIVFGNEKFMETYENIAERLHCDFIYFDITDSEETIESILKENVSKTNNSIEPLKIFNKRLCFEYFRRKGYNLTISFRVPTKGILNFNTVTGVLKKFMNGSTIENISKSFKIDRKNIIYILDRTIEVKCNDLFSMIFNNNIHNAEDLLEYEIAIPNSYI